MKPEDFSRMLETQISPESGLSQDYTNDLGGFQLMLGAGGGAPALIQFIRENHWLPEAYGDHYPVNDANREAAAKVDKLAMEFRTRLADSLDTLTVEEFGAYCQSLMDVISPGARW